MSLKTKLVNYFLENDFSSIADTPFTWKELSEHLKLGMSADATRCMWRRYNNKLVLKKQTFKGEDVAFETYGTEREGEIVDTRGMEIAKVVQTPYSNKPFVTYVPDTGLKKEELLTAIQSINFNSVTPINIPVTKWNTKNHLLVMISDEHIGLKIENSFFGMKWDNETRRERTGIIINYINSKCAGTQYERIAIVYGGDKTDGLNGFTTRGGHKLPQNLNNIEQIREGIDLTMILVDNIVSNSIPIDIHFTTNSNHGGILDKSIGETIKRVLEIKYPKMLTVNLYPSFASSFKLNNSDFLLTHGKDEEFLNRGLPKEHTNKSIDLLRNLMKYNDCKEGSTFVLRGDLHQFAYTKNEFFEDILCPSFAPPSAWIQANFNSRYAGGFIGMELKDDSLTVEKIDF